MKNALIFLVFIAVLTTSVSGTYYELIYSADFEEGANGGSFPCVYSSHYQSEPGQWSYSDVSHEGELSVVQSIYTDSLCGLPITLNFSTESYKVTFFSKVIPDIRNARGIGMQDSFNSLDNAGYSNVFAWWQQLISGETGTIFHGVHGFYLADTEMSPIVEELPSIGTDWTYHEFFITKNCVSQYVYDNISGTLLKSTPTCFFEPPITTSGKNLGLLVSQQPDVQSYFDDVKVFRIHYDSDNDGIYDEADKCINTPTNAIVDSNGCSDEQFCDQFNPLGEPKSQTRKLCTAADWKTNEQVVAKGKKIQPNDCYINLYSKKIWTDDLCGATNSAN